MTRVTFSLTLLSFSFGIAHAQPVMSSADSEFLRSQSEVLIAQSSMRTAHYLLHAPGAGYGAFWTLDADLMLGPEPFIGNYELTSWIRAISATTRMGTPWNVREGVVVPPYSVPNHVRPDSELPTFYQGTFETDSTQGGGIFGKYPPLDDRYSFIDIVYRRYKQTGIFNDWVLAGGASIALPDLIDKIYHASPVDSETGLVVASDAPENATDFGFCDAILKTGKLLMPSLMRLRAAREMSEMYASIGQTSRAKAYAADVILIRKSISSTFFNAGDGWLHSSTGIGNQADVWGTAFAVVDGSVIDDLTQRLCVTLLGAYLDGTAVRRGMVLEVPCTDSVNGGFWERSAAAQGSYQNGGYWGVPSGWYIAALAKIDMKAATSMASDFVSCIRSQLDSAGTATAWEWISADGAGKGSRYYVATVANVYQSLRAAGLL